MAFTKTPTTWIAGWSVVGTDIVVPIASFSELTSVEADGATGDIRKIVFALVEELWQAYNATAVADRPNKWSMSKMLSANAARNVLTSRYIFTLETEIGTQEVADETSSSPTGTSTTTASASSTSTTTASGTSTGTSTSTPTSTTSGSSTSTSTQSISGSDTASGTFSASATSTGTGSSTGTATSTPTSTSTSTASGTGTSTTSGSSTPTATATA